MAVFYQDLPIVLEDEGSIAEYFSEALEGDPLGILLMTLFLVESIVFAPVSIPLLLIGAFYVIFIFISLVAKGLYEDDLYLFIFFLPYLIFIVLPFQLLYWGALPFTYWPIAAFMALIIPECATSSLSYFLNPLIGPMYCTFKS